MSSMAQSEFDHVKDQLGERLHVKYRTVGEAFRQTDLDKSGDFDRQEAEQLFAMYGYGKKTADHFFNHMDHDRAGSISLAKFTGMFAPYIQPGFELDNYQKITTTSRFYHDASAAETLKELGATCAKEEAQARNENVLCPHTRKQLAVKACGGVQASRF